MPLNKTEHVRFYLENHEDILDDGIRVDDLYAQYLKNSRWEMKWMHFERSAFKGCLTRLSKEYEPLIKYQKHEGKVYHANHDDFIPWMSATSPTTTTPRRTSRPAPVPRRIRRAVTIRTPKIIEITSDDESYDEMDTLNVMMNEMVLYHP